MRKTIRRPFVVSLFLTLGLVGCLRGYNESTVRQSAPLLQVHPLLAEHEMVKNPQRLPSGELVRLFSEPFRFTRSAWEGAVAGLMERRTEVLTLPLPDERHPSTIPHEAEPLTRLLRTFDSPTLTFLFELPSGVRENFSIGMHTVAVLQRYLQQRSSLELGRLQHPHLRDSAWLDSFFLAVLATHDVGKGLAVAAHEKERQHEYTLPIQEEILRVLGFAEDERLLAARLTGHDVLGQLLTGKIEQDEAVAALKGQMRGVFASPSDFFVLAKALYFCDASAYPWVVTNVFGGRLLTENLLQESESGPYGPLLEVVRRLDELGKRAATPLP